MGKKHKHEEHVNMEAWVISYADMLTLLFALFVVLYALGEIKLKKLKDVAQSIAWAFSFDGKGQTEKPGLHSKGEEQHGKIPRMAPLLTAQKKHMVEFLSRQLPREFEEQTGSSLEIVQTDDTIAFKAPLSAYFAKGQYRSLRSNELATMLVSLIAKAHTFTSDVRIRIEAPSVVIAKDPRDGTAVRSSWLCHQRLEYLLKFITTVKNVDHPQILTEFKYTDTLMLPPGSPRSQGWEDRATLSVAFTNTPN